MVEQVTILIVDDDLTNRLVLRGLLQGSGFNTLEAVDGKQAVDLVAKNHIDIILMDVMMPVMDGYQAARAIKSTHDGFIPIIFITAMTDEIALAKCIKAGGDDFLSKPYNHMLLRAKIDSMLRISQLYKRIEAQNRELNKHHARIQQEINVAKKLFSNVLSRDKNNATTGLRFSMSPMSVFNGDMILSERNQSNGLDIIISDFTGHGLSAAIGSIPVADVFYTMTEKGYSFSETLTEVNNKLLKLLPTEMFMAAALISVDRNNNVLMVVNAGLPDLYLYRDGKIIRTFQSQNIPLGIVKQSPDNFIIEMETLAYNDRIIAATDGIIEAENKQGELFGKHRMLEAIASVSDPDLVFDTILDKSLEFAKETEQSDDITLLELCHLKEVCYEQEDIQTHELKPAEWSMQFNVDARCLRNFDLLPYIMQGINGLQSIPNGRSIIHTILTEILTNALDHGVLELDSKMKDSPEGYMKYYQEKTQRLDELSYGQIQIILNHELKENGGGRLTIHVADSGSGFDYANECLALENNRGYCGRGLALIKRLCTQVNHLGKGNAIMAVYEWD